MTIRNLRVYSNTQGFTVQWWDFWPKYVITLWWGIPPRFRVYYWRGRLRP